MPESTTILAIETSCDETGVAVLRLEDEKITVLADALASQVDIHKETGGVVPNVAAREHKKVIQPLVDKALQEAQLKPSDISAIAVTVGPGLSPALWVGVNKAQELAQEWNKPIVSVHHIEGHIYSALLSNKGEFSKNSFPALALIVSGGHTMLIKMANHLQYEILGQTRDDAAGEAFDKVARLLDLPYPGGPHLSKLAEKGDPDAIEFPRPMKGSGDLDFSFSGLKTAVLYELRDNPKEHKENIAASFQAAVIDSLLIKTKKALEADQYSSLLLAGGVAANTLLRKEIKTLAENMHIPLRIAPKELCGDNAIMIGQVGLLAFEKGRQIDPNEIKAEARIPIDTYSVFT